MKTTINANNVNLKDVKTAQLWINAKFAIMPENITLTQIMQIFVKSVTELKVGPKVAYNVLALILVKHVIKAMDGIPIQLNVVQIVLLDVKLVLLHQNVHNVHQDFD